MTIHQNASNQFDSSLPSRPQHRLIVLGASNVQRTLPTIVTLLAQRLGNQLDAWFVCGHGRSYGRTSNVLGLQLPGITKSVWRERLSHVESLPTSAILTDAGNDLLYGSEPEEILSWLNECLESLTKCGARITVIGPPVESCQLMSPTKFYIFRSLLFPGSKLTFQLAQQHLVELCDGMQRMATKFRCQWQLPSGRWYGIDPIHVRKSSAHEAWCQWSSHWSGDSTSLLLQATAPNFRDRLRLAFARRETQYFLGWNRSYGQPAWRNENGLQASFF